MDRVCDLRGKLQVVDNSGDFLEWEDSTKNLGFSLWTVICVIESLCTIVRLYMLVYRGNGFLFIGM